MLKSNCITMIFSFPVFKKMFFACLCSLFLSGCVTDDIALPSLDVFKSSPKTERYAAPPARFSKDYQGGGAREIESEELLDDNGELELVEQGRGYDPARAHMEARKKVNTKRRKKSKELSAHFEPDAPSGRDEKFRVLRVKGKGSLSVDSYKNIAVSDSAVATPEYEISENGGGGHFSKFVSVKDTVIPLRKPKIPSKYAAREKVPVAVVGQISSFSESGVANIIVPPPLPARKVKVVVAPVLAPRSAVVDDLPLVDTVIPKRKPRQWRKPEPAPRKPIYKQPVKVKKISKSPSRSSSSAGVLEKGTIASSTISVVNIRSGDHSGKGRLVLEINKPTRYKVAVDSLRNVLRIKLYNANLSIGPKGALTGSSLLGSYVARVQRDGSVLIEVRLKKKSEIVTAMSLPPNMSSGHRIVIDLKK